MDYLNPKKRRAHLIRLFTGYFLVSIAVALAVVIIFLLVHGYSYKDGTVVQNGMLFVSSSPQGANISLNGQANGTTNRRLVIPSGEYTIDLTRPGYRSWQRTVGLIGGKIQSYNYPLLLPNQLVSSPVTSISGQPAMTTESMDRNWLLVSDPANQLNFFLINLNTPASPVITALKLPDLLPAGSSGGSWHSVEWANDNQHVLLEYSSSSEHEFVLVDTQSPGKSVNLNTEFEANPSSASLFNQGISQFWFYDATSHKLSLASTSNNIISPYLGEVLGFNTYGNSIVLYATADKAGGVKVVWYQGDEAYVIARHLSLESSPEGYLLDLAQFQGDWYVIVGETSGDHVTVYKNPLQFISAYPSELPPAEYVLRVDHPSYEKFSANAQFILAESGRSVAIFNVLYNVGYNYEFDQLDTPQTHAYWMDGYHLLHVANGQLDVADFNNINQQVLVAASPAYQPFFSNNFEYLYTLQISPGSSGQVTATLNSTPLRLPADL